MSALRDLLPRTFHAFLGRFSRSTPVQERAIPPILAGRDVLITAPTASGKTEAFAAPAAEVALSSGMAGLRVLVVSPTRALANDLFRRLETPFSGAGLEIGRRTGEHKDRGPLGGLPAVAIATPEALDSLLARRPELLRALRLAVLDEIHLLDGTARGDQMRILLHRIDRAVGRRVQRVAASATVDDPPGLAARYLRDAKLVTVAGDRPILVAEFPGTGGHDAAAHVEALGAKGFRKILVFCNRRRDVESFTKAIRARTRFRDCVFPHHGSLHQGIRERSEARFLHAQVGVAVATTTLEIGIDIGSVDYVLLAGLPNSVSGLLQRIGRGNRRSSKTRAGYTWADAGDRILAMAMFRAARDGRLLGQPYALRPGVIVQQALVLAAARGRIDASALRASIPDAVWEESGLEDPQTFLDHLALAGHLERALSGSFVASEEVEEAYEAGTLHSNIAEEGGIEVVDRLTGDVVGRAEISDSGHVQLGGAARRVVAAEGRRILTDTVAGEVESRFTARGIPLVSQALARDVVRGFAAALPGGESAQKDDRDWPAFPDSGGLIVLHGLGTLGSLFLEHLLRKERGASPLAANSAFGLRWIGAPFVIPRPSRACALEFAREAEAKLAKFCAVGPWHEALPRDLRLRALHRIAGLDALLGRLAAARLRLHEAPPSLGLDWATLVDGASRRAPFAPLRGPP